MTVDIPVGTDVAEEPAPLSLGQCPPATFGMRGKRVDDTAPIETARLGLADLGSQPSEESQQAFRRRFVGHEVVIVTGLRMALGEQTATGQRHDRSFVLLVEQTQNHVHSGQAGADNRHRSFRWNVG
jgi:hypothetical protein